MEKIRTFIAIPLPDEVKLALGNATQELATQMPRQAVRWVRTDRMHLTLRFLGDTLLNSLPAIAAGLDRVARDREPLLLRLDQLGCFPNLQRPRVIWAGVRGGEKELQDLKRNIDELLLPLGWEPEDRPFRAHLTLGRVKESRKLRDVAWKTELEPLPLPVTTLLFIESELLPAGPRYTIRHTSRLAID